MFSDWMRGFSEQTPSRFQKENALRYKDLWNETVARNHLAFSEIVTISIQYLVTYTTQNQHAYTQKQQTPR
jgi:hypothetical protein